MNESDTDRHEEQPGVHPGDEPGALRPDFAEAGQAGGAPGQQALHATDDVSRTDSEEAEEAGTRQAPSEEADFPSAGGEEAASEAASGETASPDAALPDGRPCPGCPMQGDGGGEPGAEGSEPQRPRIMLEAGTDPESLRALELCREKVQQLRLRMHPLAARWDDDRHVTIFFRADDKVDFRKLVRELSYVLRARIELRQVGPREQGKLCGLVGKCGYQLCCQTFLPQFAQSSIKMAKTQDLALNPMKISGVCGRLLCCLNYEQQMYAEAKSHMPRVNRIVDTEFGQGRVVALNVLKNTVTVQFETATRELSPEQVRLAEGQS